MPELSASLSSVVSAFEFSLVGTTWRRNNADRTSGGWVGTGVVCDWRADSNAVSSGLAGLALGGGVVSASSMSEPKRLVNCKSDAWETACRGAALLSCAAGGRLIAALGISGRVTAGVLQMPRQTQCF